MSIANLPIETTSALLTTDRATDTSTTVSMDQSIQPTNTSFTLDLQPDLTSTSEPTETNDASLEMYTSTKSFIQESNLNITSTDVAIETGKLIF